LKRQVFSLRIAEIGTKLLLVTMAKQLQIKRNGTSQVSHIASVSLYIAFELGKREIVWIKCHQALVLKCSRKHFLKATFVFVGWLRNSHSIQIDAIFLE
jgi:hypothetical protein